jgi:hypothetical protein
MYRISNLALGADTLPVPQPPIIDVWSALNALCLKSLPPAECASLIGTNPVYIPKTTCKQGLPWYAYVAIGFAVGKFI